MLTSITSIIRMVDETRLDKMGVDKMGLDELGQTRKILLKV